MIKRLSKTCTMLLCFRIKLTNDECTRKFTQEICKHRTVTPHRLSFLFLLVLITIRIIMITFKGTIPDFLQSPHCATNCLQHVHSNGQSATVCKSCATHRELITCNMCQVVRRDNSAIESDILNHIYCSFILLAETINR